MKYYVGTYVLFKYFEIQNKELKMNEILKYLPT